MNQPAKKRSHNIIESLLPLAVTIDKVKLDPRNARLHLESNMAAIQRSLEAYGQRKPIVVNARTGAIEAGNGLFQAAVKLGWTHIAAVMVADDEDTAKGYAIMDNQSALLAEWDFPVLKDLLQELDTGAFNMDLTGFNQGEIEDLMTRFQVIEPGKTDEDAIPEEVETICKTGDLWQLGEHRLLCGDAIRAEDVERLMDGKKADMVFTDPPYGVNYQPEATGRSKKRWAKIAHDDITDPLFFKEWGTLLLSITRANAAYYICMVDKNLDVVVRSLKESGIYVNLFIIWVKNQAPITWNRYHNKHEIMIYAGEGAKPTSPKSRWYGPNNEVTVWEIDKDAHSSYEHPTQKPVALAERAIKNSSAIKQLVLDPFGGSGSTVIACEKLNRRCFMLEIAPHYCDVIIGRWQNFTGRKAVKL